MQISRNIKVCGGLLCLVLMSCGGMGEDAGAIAERARQFSIGDLRPAKVGVVEVREKDLKPLPTGEERALAYERSSRRIARFFVPVDLPEPDMSIDAAPIDGSLLPSLDL